MAKNNQRSESVEIYNVTRLNREVRTILEGSFPPIWVQGEISNLARPASGHMYFSLKDERSQVRCAMFRGRNRSINFNPENGLSVLVKANVSLYEDRGEFQLIVDYMEPAGYGALQQAFEALKKKLFDEGLFDDKHKQAIPRMARTIGVITSPTGAAIRDVLSILRRRFRGIEIIVYPAAVQGEDAQVQIIDRLKTAQRRNECEVLLLVRGGGSLEDLWAFNNEVLAREIFSCRIPVVTGIGHEIDFTIADFVADQRAPTPSAAAELVSPDQVHLVTGLLQTQKKLHRLMISLIYELNQRIQHLQKRTPHPERTLQTIQQRLDNISVRLRHSILSSINVKKTLLGEIYMTLHQLNPFTVLQIFNERCNQLRQRLNLAVNQLLKQFLSSLKNTSHALDTVSPLSTLNRGYSILIKPETHEIVRDAGQLISGDNLDARFSKGHALCTVTKTFRND